MAFNIAVVTPEKVLFEGDVYMAILPGAMGEFSLLERHTPIVYALKAGDVRLQATPQADYTSFTIASGVAEMAPDGRCRVFVTTA